VPFLRGFSRSAKQDSKASTRRADEGAKRTLSFLWPEAGEERVIHSREFVIDHEPGLEQKTSERSTPNPLKRGSFRMAPSSRLQRTQTGIGAHRAEARTRFPASNPPNLPLGGENFPVHSRYISQNVKRHESKAGFTLVEVIVVIVIIAILAAIGVPALTGYIDKAQDKKWELQARDFAQAMRSVYADAYADGTLGSTPNGHTYMTYGGTWDSWALKSFDTWTMGSKDTDDEDGGVYINRARTLMGNNELSGFDFVAPKDLSYNVLNAPAFFSWTFPEGNVDANSPVILVTYGFDGPIPETNARGAFITAIMGNWAYDADAGYQVFHLIRG
jgi:prepilin-type N-terminal cleavage/methylation domain-containing protein